jgi:hypothetical protein
MPEAIAGEESSGNTYRFKVNATSKEVQDFYTEKLTALGWTQPFSIPAEGGFMNFTKDKISLAIAVIPSEGSVVVLLVITQV